MKKIESHIATNPKQPIRLQEYGIGIFTNLPTKSALKKAIKKQLIYVNGKVASTATYIHDNDVIGYHAPEEEPKKKFLLDLEVIYEDEHLAVINKPAGILVNGNTLKTIDNALMQNLKKSPQPDAIRPRPAHRLDYATTGLLLVGKTTHSLCALNKMFEHKQIEKTYVAISIGAMNLKGSITFTVDGKNAVTDYSVLKTVTSKRFGALNFVRLCPKTGRRHQLRQHLLALGNPILGDPVYHKKGLFLKGKGLYLHAYSLRFMHPFTNELLYFKKETSLKFQKILKNKSRS